MLVAPLAWREPVVLTALILADDTPASCRSLAAPFSRMMADVIEHGQA
jgi:hypothetical protein